MCDLNILGTRIEASVSPSQNRGVTDNLRKFKMKLNPEKCTFGVPLEKLLGYMISR
jgi:hypothetical protein